MLLKLSETKGDSQKAAEYRETLTNLYFKAGDKLSALASAEKLFDFFKNDKKKLAPLYLKKGQIYGASYYGASTALNKAAKLFEETGDEAGLATTEYCLGILSLSKSYDEKKYEKAAGHFVRSAALFHSQKDMRGLTLSLIGKSKCLVSEENYHEAETLLEAAVDSSRNIDETDYLENALYHLARTYHLEEKDFKAQKQIEEAVSLNRQSGETGTMAQKLQLYGEILLSLEKYDEAVSAFKECEKIKRQTGDLDNIDEIIHLTAYTLFKKGDYENALLYFQEELLTHDGTEISISVIYRSLAMTYRHLGYKRESAYYFKKQIDALSGSEYYKQELIEALYNFAEICSNGGGSQENAQKACETALQLYETLDEDEARESRQYKTLAEKLLSEIRSRKTKFLNNIQDNGLQTPYTSDYIRKAVFSLVSDILETKDVKSESSFTKDLAASEIDMLKIINAADNEFDIDINIDDNFDSIKTVGDLLKIIKKTLHS
jgi:acyl carrier protein